MRNIIMHIAKRNERIENQWVEYKIKYGIVFGRFKNGASVDLITAKKLIETRLVLQNGRDLPLLVDITGLRHVTKDARDFFASNESLRGTIAGALIVGKSLFSRTLGNIFFLLSRPEIPHKMFGSAVPAMRWLKRYRGYS